MARCLDPSKGLLPFDVEVAPDRRQKLTESSSLMRADGNARTIAPWVVHSMSDGRTRPHLLRFPFPLTTAPEVQAIFHMSLTAPVHTKSCRYKHQQPFLPVLDSYNYRRTHGGSLSRGKRKKRRPVSTKKAMHIVMRAESAKKELSLRHPRNLLIVEHSIRSFAKRFHIRIYRFSINSNHIHIMQRAKSRELFQNYLRALAGTIARKVKRIKGKFWDNLAFSRVVEWEHEFKVAMNYVLKNQLEAIGKIPHVRSQGRGPPETPPPCKRERAKAPSIKGFKN